ncbi:MAG: DNA-binding response regulator, partial [Candidatus Obscuribacterales bacterium]|nr:DNA-binding response regulator [Steroidobacteraceae bacterium]
MHRSTLVNLKFVNETVPWFGNVVVKLNDEKETKLTVAH